MTFDPTPKPPRRKMTYESISSTRSPTTEEVVQARNLSDTMRASASPPQFPTIRTPKPSTTDARSNSTTPKPHSAASDSSQGRNWAELATFMRTQREKGFNEIRPPKTVHFKGTDSPRSGSSSPSLPLPGRPKDRSRPSSPATRPIPPRRYAEDEDWSQPPRPPREHILDDGRTYSASSSSSRRPSQPNYPSRSQSPMGDSSSRRKFHETTSPLSFGARGSSIKPYGQVGQDPPTVPVKAENREQMKTDERERRRVYSEEDKNERRHNGELNGVGLGIHSHGVRERVGRVESTRI